MSENIKNITNEEEFIDKKDLRDQAIDRVEVLDKVKELFLIPKMELMTTNQVADYYEVGLNIIKMCYQRNKAEIDEDGTVVKTKKDFNALACLKSHDVTSDALMRESKGNELPESEPYIDEVINTGSSGATYKFSNGIILKVQNRGIRCFSKRAVLRIGMLLRDSDVAKEVRTQLLNVFEKTSDEQKAADIEEEQDLYLKYAKAAIEGDKDDLLFAAQEVFNFKNRHIKMLQEKNDELRQDNQMLAAQILEWSERSKISKAVRVIAGLRKVPFGYVWRDLYQELLYKHHIGLTMRGKKPFIQHVREEEWPMVQQSLAAICEDHGISISKVLWKIKHDDPKKYIDKETEDDENSRNNEKEED